MKTSYLGLMVKRLNQIETLVDDFSDLSSDISDFLEYPDDDDYPKYNYEPRNLEVVEIVGSILMSMMLPGLIVASFFLIIQVILFLVSNMNMIQRLKMFCCGNSYKELDKIKLDPEKLALPKKPKERKACISVIRISSTIIMVCTVLMVAMSHLSIWNKWGANIDSINTLSSSSTLSIRDLHSDLKNTLDSVTTNLGVVHMYMPKALEELNDLTSVDVREIIEDKIDRVTGKGEFISEVGENLDRFVVDSDNKTLSVILSLFYMASSLITLWFWFILISYRYEGRIVWYLSVFWWCFTILVIILYQIYINLFIPYLVSMVHKDSNFILFMLGQVSPIE